MSLPAAAEPLTLARELQPLIAAHAAAGEAGHRLADEVVRALTEAGLFQLSLPAAQGGHGASMRLLLEVSALIAEADGAASWVLTLGNACGWMVSLFPERVTAEVFGANPLARVSGALGPTAVAERVSGGYLVTGKWAYSSGIAHADWTFLGIPLERSPAVGIALVPATDYLVERTWKAVGMQGTGSDSVVAERIFVPDRRIADLTTIRREVPIFAPFITLILAGPQLGMGRAALRLVRDAASGRGITGTTYTRQADSVGFQLQLAEAALKIDTAHLHASRAADDIDAVWSGGGDFDPVVRARVHADTGLAAQQVVSAIDLLLSAHGARAFADSHPLQKIWRDANTALRHAMAQPVVNYEIYGKALLGISPNIATML